MSGDNVKNLPVDQNAPTENESNMVNILFKENQGALNNIFRECKDILLLVGLFILISLPYVEELLNKYVSITANSQYISIIIKGLLLGLVYFIIKNLYLAKKQ